MKMHMRCALVAVAISVCFGGRVQSQEAKGDDIAALQGLTMVRGAQAENANLLKQIRDASPAPDSDSAAKSIGYTSSPVTPEVLGVFTEQGVARLAVVLGGQGRAYLAAGESTPDGHWLVAAKNGTLVLVPAAPHQARKGKRP